jgi:hypothetical protein
MSKEFDDFMDSVKKLSEESWEGCDGCTEQDEVMYKNGYVKGYNAAIAELPKEISNEEIENVAERLQKDKYGIFISKEADVKGQLVLDTAKAAFLSGMIEGAKWYREQLKQKQ